MNVSKDQFVQIIDALIEQDERDVEIGGFLDGVARDGHNQGIVFNTPLIEKIVAALDYDGIISWWFWDGPDCGEKADIYTIGHPKDFSQVVIRNSSDLYDYIMEAKK